MRLPLEVTFRDMPPSEALETRIREKAAKLDRFSDQIMGCRVVVELPHKHHHKGNLYRVRVLISVPSGELVADRSKQDHHESEDVYVALRDAFRAIQRQLEDYARVRRGEVKCHDETPRGRILVLFPAEDYGRISTMDGREIYFHRHALVNQDFDKLEVGTPVRYVETTGDEGPQASAVTVLGAEHAAA
jgi:ribosomal subunit interface protein